MNYLTVGLLTLVLFSCGTEEAKTPDQIKEEAREAILLERSKLLNSTGELDTNQANTIIDMYITFVQNNTDDKDASEFMFQAGSLCVGKGDYKRAIRLLENVTKNYGDDKRAVEAYFLTAFIYENYLNQKGAAEDAYKLVIEKFPRHDLALQSRAAIENLTKTDEELIRMFEEKNQGS